MGYSRKPGPWGIRDTGNVQDGTQVKQPSGKPGVATNVRQKLNQLENDPHRRRRKKGTRKGLHFPFLQEGMRGEQVALLQQLLISRMPGKAPMRVDGFFGPEMRARVLEYQMGVGLRIDGKVGRETWQALMAGCVPGGPVGIQLSNMEFGHPRELPPPLVTADIWDWPLERKIESVLERVPGRFGKQASSAWDYAKDWQEHKMELAEGLALFALISIISMGAADLLLLALGVDIGWTLASMVHHTIMAKRDEDLDAAADDLLHVIEAVGIVLLLHKLGEVNRGRGVSVAEEGDAAVAKEGAKSPTSSATENLRDAPDPHSKPPPEEVSKAKTTASKAKEDPLDWSTTSKKGETRVEHIQKHAVDNLNKPLHGVFNEDPVATTKEAWSKAQSAGIKPVLDNGMDVYDIPMGREVGWQGGAEGTGAPLSNVRIVTTPGTPKIITAFPN